MKTIHKALLEAQKVITHATKDATNPHFKSKYATLESVIDAVKKPLNDAGIYITHSTSVDGNLMTSLIHAESGESIVSQSPLIMNRQDMQQLGSAQTYAKRFNLTALLNLPTEDDDGNTVSQPVKSKPQTQLQPKLTQPKDGVYIFKVGKQTKSKRIDEISQDVLLGYFNWAKDQPEVKGLLKDDLEAMQKYIDEKGIVPF